VSSRRSDAARVTVLQAKRAAPLAIRARSDLCRGVRHEVDVIGATAGNGIRWE